MKTKLILDTDIGTDVDDAWALALALGSNRIDLAGVTLVHADLDTRAKIAFKMLRLAGRGEVPVYRGLSNTLTPGGKLYWRGHEGTETDFSDVEGMTARKGAVDFILDTVSRYPRQVVVCSIGPVTNVAAAIARSPEIMHQVKHLAIMGGTFAGYGPTAAAPEHNAAVDPLATKVLFESGIPATVVGLNVTMKVMVKRDQLGVLEGWPLGEYIAAMTRQYMAVCGRDHCYMHDPLAVATVIDPSLVKTQPMKCLVLDDGRIAWSDAPKGSQLDVCTDVKVEKFQQLLLDTVASLRGKGE